MARKGYTRGSSSGVSRHVAGKSESVQQEAHDRHRMITGWSNCTGTGLRSELVEVGGRIVQGG